MNTITLSDKVERIAFSMFLCAAKSSGEKSLIFRNLINVEIDGCTMLLLVLGHAYPGQRDGSCIAILNPNKSLVSQIIPGYRYSSLILKGLVTGRCDLTLAFWMDMTMGINIRRTIKYLSSPLSPAKFSLQEIKWE